MVIFILKMHIHSDYSPSYSYSSSWSVLSVSAVIVVGGGVGVVVGGDGRGDFLYRCLRCSRSCRSRLVLVDSGCGVCISVEVGVRGVVVGVKGVAVEDVERVA